MLPPPLVRLCKTCTQFLTEIQLLHYLIIELPLKDREETEIFRNYVWNSFPIEATDYHSRHYH